MPVVTQTTACFWSRPVAKAFGMSTLAMATWGLGMLAIAHKPVDHPVELGRLLAGDDLAAHRVERDPVREEVLDEQQRERDDEDEDELEPDEEEHRDEQRRRAGRAGRRS